MTSVLGSVFRAVLTVSRTAFIWAFDVALYYSAWSNGARLPFATACYNSDLASYVIHVRASFCSVPALAQCCL